MSRPTAPFEVPELLANIFEQMADNEASLATCARVSRQWSVLALETLWGARPLFASRLMAVIPDSAKEATPHGFSKAATNGLRNQKFITRPLTASELARLQIYASLITHLRFDQDDSIHSYLLARLKFPNVSVLECQPLVDIETVLTLEPLVGPSLKRCLLVLDDDEDEEDSDEELEEDEDDTYAYYHSDSAAAFNAINWLSHSTTHLHTLDLSFGPNQSSNFLHLLKPLSKTLTSLSMNIRNFPRIKPNPFPIQSLYHLDGFEALTELYLRAVQIAKVPSSSTTPREIHLPALKTFRSAALTTSLLRHILPLIPAKIENLAVYEAFYDPLDERRHPASDFTSLLGRFEGLRSFSLASPAMMRHTPFKPHKKLIQALKPFLVRLGPQLETLHCANPYVSFGSNFLVELARAYPKLEDLAIVTEGLTYSHLHALAEAAPNLRRLAVSPYISADEKRILGGGEDGNQPKWAFSSKLESFGGLFSRVTSMRGPNQASIREAIEEDVSFKAHFPLPCRFADADPLGDFYEEKSNLWRFQKAQDEELGGGGENAFMSDEDDASSIDDDDSFDEDENEVMDGSEDEDSEENGEEGDGDGWVDDSEAEVDDPMDPEVLIME